VTACLFFLVAAENKGCGSCRREMLLVGRGKLVYGNDELAVGKAFPFTANLN
jgi:hypothetical protein